MAIVITFALQFAIFLFMAIFFPFMQACKCRSNATYCHSSGIDGSGISNADFALYVSFTSSHNCGKSTLAYASYCALEPSLDRYAGIRAGAMHVQQSIAIYAVHIQRTSVHRSGYLWINM